MAAAKGRRPQPRDRKGRFASGGGRPGGGKGWRTDDPDAPAERPNVAKKPAAKKRTPPKKKPAQRARTAAKRADRGADRVARKVIWGAAARLARKIAGSA